jgi:tetratricopeptide (TPR) repeat protein
MRSRKNTLISALIIVLGFWAVFVLSSYLEQNRITVPESYSDEDLDFQGKKLKGFALGTEGLLSDWYWMRALQYIGGKIVNQGLDNLNLDDLTGLNPRLLYPMLDNATDLDPKSMAPFSYGATILPAISSEQAIKLTEKGIAHNPDNWRLYQYLGYIHWRLKDYEKAGATYDKGADIPGAPPFFRMMAARIRTESGSRDLAREIYKQSIAEAPDEGTRQSSEIRLMELDSMDERDVLDAVLKESRERTGSCARKWSDILPRLAKANLPNGRDFRINIESEVIDPSGVPYEIEPTICRTAISEGSKLPLQ